MAKLQCDICGGSIVMQGGGKTAVCDSCGMRYGIERMREKVQGILGTDRIEGTVQGQQTGTEDNISQWRKLLKRYYDAGDFHAAEEIVKKILEASPSDDQAVKMYDELQILKFIEVKNGVLVNYSGQVESLRIPSCVKAIGPYAFSNFGRNMGRNSIKKVFLPFGIKEIGERAFAECLTLEVVTIPESVKIIGSSAFSCCEALQSIDIPESIEIIGNNAFHSCKALKTIFIPNGVKKIGESAFCGCSALESLTIPKSVKTIEAETFRRCTALMSIVIADGVETIGKTAFCDCMALESITIPNSVAHIEEGAFASCINLKSIKIPASAKEIGNGVFYKCNRLVEIDMPEQLYHESIFVADARLGYDSTDAYCNYYSPWYVKMHKVNEMRKLQEYRRHTCVCQYCGGDFSGFFTKKCIKCGKPKDY